MPMTLAFSCEAVHEKLWKSVNICKSYSKKSVAPFFWTRCRMVGLYPMVKKFRRYLYSFWQKVRTWLTDRRTDTTWRHRPRLCIASRGNDTAAGVSTARLQVRNERSQNHERPFPVKTMPSHTKIVVAKTPAVKRLCILNYWVNISCNLVKLEA